LDLSSSCSNLSWALCSEHLDQSAGSILGIRCWRIGYNFSISISDVANACHPEHSHL
jgi:hypothetical protein